MAEVARLYYVRELTQQQIAERLGVSRFKVLRLLEQARTEGVVRFEIDEPVPVLDELSRALEDRFGITAVVVAHDVAGAAAELLPRLLAADDVLGVAWGETLAAIATRLASSLVGAARRPDLRRDRGSRAGHGADRARRTLRRVVGGRFHPLEAPAVADERALRRAVRPTTAIFDACPSSSSASGREPRQRGTCSSTSSTDDGRIVSAERSIALSVPSSGGRAWSRPRRADVASSVLSSVRSRHRPDATSLVTDAAAARRHAGCRGRPPSSPGRRAGSERDGGRVRATRASTSTASTSTTRSRSSTGSTRSCARTGSAGGGSGTDRSNLHRRGLGRGARREPEERVPLREAGDPAAARERRRRNRHASRPCSGSSAATRDFATHAYAASKAGLIGLTRAMAVDVRARGDPLQRGGAPAWSRRR